MKSLLATFSGVCLFLAAAPLCLCSGLHEKGAETTASCCSHPTTDPDEEAPCPHCDQAGSLVVDKVPASEFPNGPVGIDSALPQFDITIVSAGPRKGGSIHVSRAGAPPPSGGWQALHCVYRV